MDIKKTYKNIVLSQHQLQMTASRLAMFTVSLFFRRNAPISDPSPNGATNQAGAAFSTPAGNA